MEVGVNTAMCDSGSLVSDAGLDKSCGPDVPNSSPITSVQVVEALAVSESELPTDAQSHVVIALQAPDGVGDGSGTDLPLSKETLVGLGHTEAEAETISQIFIEVCSAESMGLFNNHGQVTSGGDQSGTDTTGQTREEEIPEGLRILRDQSVQVNDYEIERSGKLPARRRIIPHKFRDFRTTGESGDESNEDSDYDPENDFVPAKRGRGSGRGKPADSNQFEGDEKPGSQRGRGRGRGRGSYRRGKGFPCPDCDKVFTLRGNLKVHMRIHKGEKPYTCEFEGCTKTFRTNETLRRHKLSHLGIKPFECEVCRKKFSCNVSLREHMSIHDDLRPYECDQCKKTFRHISTFSRHMTVHSAETPYTCGECGKKFAQMAYLRSHQRVHTGAKPFTCDQCGKSFAHQSDLIRHKVIHTGQKPYVCDICNARFTDPSSRRRHMKEHSGSKPYPCELCGDEFKRAGQLKVHLSRVHNAVAETVKLTTHGDKGAVQFLYNTATGTSGSSDLERDKLVRLIRSLSNNESVQQVALVGQPEIPGCHGDEVTKNTPEADCEQILIEAAQAGEVTVQTMGEQLIVTSLTESPDEQTVSQQPEIQVETQNSQDVRLVDKDVSLEQTVIHIAESMNQKPATPQCLEALTTVENIEGKISGTEENLEQQEVPVEYMYGIIEDMETDGSPSEVVEICCESEEAVLEGTKSAEVSVEEESEEPDTEVESVSKVTTESLSTAVDYVTNPDFSSQGYYNWLSNFTELCKLVPMPLDVDLFQKISQVHKTLSDVMATPSGVLSNKENYKILMTITRDLNVIINEHLAFVLDNLDNSKETS